MTKDVVVGYYYPCMMEYSIPAAIECINTLPSQFLLAGGFDTCSAFIGSPNLLLRTNGYPPLLWMTALKTDKEDVGYHIEAYGYNLTFRSKYGAADIEKKPGTKVYGALYQISRAAEKRLDVYEEYPTLYKKMYFKYQNKKVMTYIMPKKTKTVPPKTRYLNVIKQGYKDCKLSMKSLNVALSQLKHI